MSTVPAALGGIFREGYTPDDVNRVFGPLSWEEGSRLVCLWDYIDYAGPGGDSEFYVAKNGSFRHVDMKICAFLLMGDPEDGDLPLEGFADYATPPFSAHGLVELDGHNFAREDRR